MRRRAKAVLFFKHFDSNSALNQINHEFTNIQHRKGETINTLGKDEKDRYEIYKQDVSNEMSASSAQDKGRVKFWHRRRIAGQSCVRMSAKLWRTHRKPIPERNRELCQGCRPCCLRAVCPRPGITTVTQLRGKYAEHAAKLKDWDFYSGCLKQLTDMGISEAHAELYLQRTLEA